MGLPRLDEQGSTHIGYWFTFLSIDLARFGGYENLARNDLNPAAHLNWSQDVHDRLLVMWDLAEKYCVQLGNIDYLGNTAEFEGLSGMSAHLRERLERVDAALEKAIPVYRRIVGGLDPTPDYWIDKSGVQGAYWRLRVFFAIAVASLNQFGVDYGNSEKNSLDLRAHYDWSDHPRRSRSRLEDTLEERIGKAFEFAHAGPTNLVSMWFASESDTGGLVTQALLDFCADEPSVPPPLNLARSAGRTVEVTQN